MAVAELSDEPRFKILSRYDVAEHALARIPQEKPDVVIMDLVWKNQISAALSVCCV
jgi:DNA-binding NarL/FixJ family response regulator